MFKSCEFADGWQQRLALLVDVERQQNPSIRMCSGERSFARRDSDPECAAEPDTDEHADIHANGDRDADEHAHACTTCGRWRRRLIRGSEGVGKGRREQRLCNMVWPDHVGGDGSIRCRAMGAPARASPMSLSYVSSRCCFRNCSRSAMMAPVEGNSGGCLRGWAPVAS